MKRSSAPDAETATLLPPLAGLLPDFVAAEAAPIADHDEDLFPEERADLERASNSRRREFSTGRWLAHRMLAVQGGPATAIRRQADRSARWPSGFVGSISHSGSVCVVAVARSNAVTAIGIDLEPDEAVKPGIERMVCFGDELAWIGAAGVAEYGRRVRLVFSAKEAVYKAFHFRTRRVWGFAEVSVAFDLEARTFRAALPGDAGPPEVVGRFVRANDWILTAVVWPSDVAQARARATPSSGDRGSD